MSQPVQRTLLLTCGPTAQQVGQKVQQLLVAHHGPAAAVVWFDLPAQPPAQLPLSDLQTSLHSLAQKQLVGELAAAGWHLDRLPDIAVYLVLDAAASLHGLPTLWREQLAHLGRHYFGGEIAPALFWLLPDPLAETAADCLAHTESELRQWSRGSYVLGLLNAAGFRLADNLALAQTCAELLYLLIATPLRDAPDWLSEAVPDGGFIVPGLAGWHWQAEPLFQHLLSIWLQQMFDQLLAPAISGMAFPLTPSAWLHQQGLTWNLLVPQLLSPEEQNLPDFRAGRWLTPWPWEIRPLLAEQKRRAELDQAALVEKQETLVLRADLSLHEDEQALRVMLKTCLNQNPIGGLDLTQSWLDGLLAMTLQEREQMSQQQERQRQHQERLLIESRQLESQIGHLLQKWPDGDTLTWTACAWRLWRWPKWGWQYQQLRRLGLQLSHNLAQQAELSRQQLRYHAALHLYRQWERIGQRIKGQIEEIGEMVDSLRRTLIASEASVDPSLRPSDQRWPDWPRWPGQPLMPKGGERELLWAAPSLFLGEQIERLDDGLGETLRQEGLLRLAPWRELPAIEGLRWHYPEASALETWWVQWWHEAAPLWRPDETRLSELNRHGQSAFAWAVAHRVQQLEEWLADNALTHNLSWLETADPHRLWLLRLHGGLNAAALLPHFFAADEEE